MRRKTVLLPLTAMLVCLLCACVSWSAEDAYKLPRPPAEYENLMSTIAQTKKDLAFRYNASVEDVSPSAGENTSAVQLLDMDSDGLRETAVTFLRVVGAQDPLHICFYELQPDGSYRPAGEISGEGDSVYSILYADVDGARDPETESTRKEAVVSWQMGSNAYFLGVYAIDGGQTTELVSTAYHAYRLTDLDQDGRAELAVCRIDTEQQTGRVDFYVWSGARACQIVSVPLSAGITAVTQGAAERLSDLSPVLCVIGALADESRTVELIACPQGQFRNLTLAEETGVSREHVDSYRETLFSDVNGEGTVDIARPRLLPGKEGAPDTWLLDWVQYSSSGRSRRVCTTYHNTADGWYLILPSEWSSILDVRRSDNVPGQRTVVFSRRWAEDAEPQPFLNIYKLTGANRNLRAVSNGRFILAEDSSTVYAASFQGTWNCGLSETDLLDSFRLIVSSWSGE